MPRKRDLGRFVQKAERELDLWCRKLTGRFDSEVVRGRTPAVRLEGLKRQDSTLAEMGPPCVRLPVTILQQPPVEILAALLHGMVHWLNGLQGVADCTYQGYHNRQFRELAEKVGFQVGERVPQRGYLATKPSAQLTRELHALHVSMSWLDLTGHELPPVKARRCKANLPRGEAASPYWRSAETLLPKVPRYRLELVRDGDHPDETYPRVRTGADAAALFWQILCRFDREALAVLFLDRRQRVIGYDIPYVGTLDRAVVEPRGVLAPALLLNAAAVVVAHNHPAGDPRPSREDRLFTRRLAEVSAPLGVTLAGSIVVGFGGRWWPIPPSRG